MKFFIDTEFYEKPNSIDLISIGIVSYTGQKFYGEVSDCNKEEVEKDHWLKENVIPNLKYWNYNFMNSTSVQIFNGVKEVVCQKEYLGQEILAWMEQFGNCLKPEFYGYYCDYDWVVFCWLFGRMADLPKHFPMYCKDLKQYKDDYNDERKNNKLYL